MDYFKTIFLPVLIFMVVSIVIASAVTEVRCKSLGEMYKTESNVVMMDCYLKDSSGNWITDNLYQIRAALQN